MTWKAYYRETGYELQPGDTVRFTSGRNTKFHGVTDDGKHIKTGPAVEDIHSINSFPDVTIRRHAGTINLEPKWIGLVPLLIATLQDGTPTGKQLAREELERMARAADAYNAGIK